MTANCRQGMPPRYSAATDTAALPRKSCGPRDQRARTERLVRAALPCHAEAAPRAEDTLAIERELGAALGLRVTFETEKARGA